MTRVVDERVLTPISEARPCGEDLRGLRDWVALRASRPKADEPADLGAWAPANPLKTDWATYREIVETMLCTRSKDLELGIFLTEASARVFGFVGARDGLWAISGLITNFRDKGLLPEPDGDDLEAQYGKLDWLNEKFADVLREVPITFRPAPAVNYSLNYRNESLRSGGMITAAEFEAAVGVGTQEQYEALMTAVEETLSELSSLERVVDEAYGEGALSFTQARQALEECHAALKSILRSRGASTPASLPRFPSDSTGVSPMAGAGVHSAAPFVSSDAWHQAERLARTGEVDRALSSMATLAAAEPNGRVRFQRKLLLADLCLATNRKRLAKSILEELDETIEQHKLESWETSEIVGAVWSRLVRCYRDKDAGTADSRKEQDFFLKLSRLDPWQALACGEPVGKE